MNSRGHSLEYLPINRWIGATPGSSAMIANNAVRVLLAEDDEGIRELLQFELSDLGYSVVAVESGDAASQKLENGCFDLLLTDVQMPGHLSGLDLAKRAQRLTPALPVIFMTGRSDLVHAPLQPHQLLIQKPFAVANIVAGIDQLLH